MSQAVRRLASLALAGFFVAASLAGQPLSTRAADLTVSQAEHSLLNLLASDRTRAGRVPARVDSRLMAIARARSYDMATKHYYSHTQPDGRNVFDIMDAKGITSYGAGEIIAANNWLTLGDSAIVANDSWLGSAPHLAILMASSYNYVGVGLAIDPSNGKKLWTAVFMKGPDRTGGWVQMTSLSTLSTFTITSVASSRYVTLKWRGGDVLLSVLTAGFHHYAGQIRIDGGTWGWFPSSTTGTSKVLHAWRGHVYDFRVRACDRAGNCGAWAYQRVLG